MAKVYKQCFCGKEHTVEVKDIRSYIRWQKGVGHIQNMLPELNETEREQLLSGMCPECQDEIFKDYGEEYDE